MNSTKSFTAKSFDQDFALVSGVFLPDSGRSSITIPDGIRIDHFLAWIQALPERQTPSWLGLPDNAEKVLLTNQSSSMVGKLLKLQLLEDDEEVVSGEEVASKEVQVVEGRPAWMRTPLNSAATWLRLLPNSLPVLRRTAENIKDPLYRFFEREVNSGAALLTILRQDLEDVQLICRGEKKQSNYHRNMVSDLAKGLIPAHWKKYLVPGESTVIQWVTDFSDRVKQLQKVSNTCISSGPTGLRVLTSAYLLFNC